MNDSTRRYLDWAFCISLPTILMIKNWDVLVFRNVNKEYFAYQPNVFSYLGALALVTITALLIALGLKAFRRTKSTALSWALSALFLASFLVVLGFVRESQGFGLNWLNELRFRFGTRIDMVLVGIIGAIGLAGLVYTRLIARAAFALVVVLTPFSLSVLGQAAWAAATSELPRPQAQAADTRIPSRKVVVLLFDALDTRVLFERRPDGWEFPAFDKLRSQALYAPNTTAPGGRTIRAIPALLTGNAVAESTILSGPDLDIRFENGGEARLTSVETVFQRVKNLGLESSVVGFHHPYCSLFANVLAECYRVATATPELEPPQTIFVSIKRQAIGLSPLHFRQAAIASYKLIRERGIRLAAKGGSDFVFIHASVPHYPPIYDAKKAAFTLFNTGSDGYIDNVALADRLLSELRRTLESDGSWDDLTLIVTADHGWGDGRFYYGDKNDRVPFLVKLPNQVDSVEYSPEVSALVIADLIVESLTDRISTPLELTGWLQRRTSADSKTAAVSDN